MTISTLWLDADQAFLGSDTLCYGEGDVCTGEATKMWVMPHACWALVATGQINFGQHIFANHTHEDFDAVVAAVPNDLTEVRDGWRGPKLGIQGILLAGWSMKRASMAATAWRYDPDADTAWQTDLPPGALAATPIKPEDRPQAFDRNGRSPLQWTVDVARLAVSTHATIATPPGGRLMVAHLDHRKGPRRPTITLMDVCELPAGKVEPARHPVAA